jgi:hypothetical protein
MLVLMLLSRLRDRSCCCLVPFEAAVVRCNLIYRTGSDKALLLLLLAR